MDAILVWTNFQNYLKNGASLYLLANAYNPLISSCFLIFVKPKKKIKPNIYTTILLDGVGWGWGWSLTWSWKAENFSMSKYSSILHWFFFFWIICQKWYCSTAPLHSHLIIDFTFPFNNRDAVIDFTHQQKSKIDVTNDILANECISILILIRSHNYQIINFNTTPQIPEPIYSVKYP